MATRVIRVTPTGFAGTTDASNQVVFNPTEIPGAVSANGKSATIKSVTMIDYNDNISKNMVYYFFQKGDNDLGTLGAVIDITDAELLANKFLGHITINGVGTGKGGDFILATAGTFLETNSGVGVKAEFDSSSIYVAGVAASSGRVSTASGLELVITLED